MKYHAHRFGLAQLFFHSSALLALLSFPLGGAFADPPETPGRVVNCDHGGRLAVAVRNARPGDTIRFTGTCKEQVTITTDRLTLDGQGEGVIDGSEATCPTLESGTESEEEEIVGLVEIDAAQGVTLEGLTVQHSQCDGIFFRGSSATLHDVIVYDSGDDGIDSEQAAITLESSTSSPPSTILRNNVENGMNLDNNSTANIFKGTVAIYANGRFGVLNNSSLLFVSSGAELDVHLNGRTDLEVPQGTGIGVFAGGELIGYTESNLSVYKNIVRGLLLINSGMFLSYTVVNISNNGDGNFPPGLGSAGIALVDDSVFTQTGGTLTITNDEATNLAFGMTADNSTVALRMAASNDEFAISKLLLTFGARATLIGNIPEIVCDDTVLVQGLACTVTLP